MPSRACRRKAAELLEQVADDGSVRPHEILRALQLASGGVLCNIWDDSANLAYGAYTVTGVLAAYILDGGSTGARQQKRILLEAAGVLRDGWSPGEVLVEIGSRS